MNPADSHGLAHCLSPILWHKSFWALGSKEQLIKADVNEYLSMLAFLLVLEPCISSWTPLSPERKSRKMTGGKNVQLFVGSEMKSIWMGGRVTELALLDSALGVGGADSVISRGPLQLQIFSGSVNVTAAPLLFNFGIFIGKILVPTLAQFRITIGISHLWLLWFCLSLFGERELFSHTRLAGGHLCTAEYCWSYHPESSVSVCSLSPVLQDSLVVLFGFWSKTVILPLSV